MPEKPLFFFDRDDLVARAEKHAAEYQSAHPFPHIVLEDFLPLDVAKMCEQEFPGAEDISWDKYSDGGHTLKLATSKEAIMPASIRQVVSQFNSAAMVEFLERLTGITGLIPDPHLVGGGLHRIERGGFLDIHADFNQHSVLRLDRRLNLLLYLNPDWDEEWGGQLELWDSSMRACESRISPTFNRCVIFNTTDSSFHGHPHPLACPSSIARRSFAFYYYTNGRPLDERTEAHSTLYQTERVDGRPFDVARLRAAVGKRLPPGVKQAVRSFQSGSRTIVSRLDAPSKTHNSASRAISEAPENHWARVNRIFSEEVARGGIVRPNYLWSLLHVGDVARTLRIPRITAIEFGVAGGNGLVALEGAADAVERRLGTAIDVVGFDHGKGLPPPLDYRDAPYLMQPGQFAMDEKKLRARLHRASLYIGLVSETLGEFAESRSAPIGFISLDLDFYSSTMDALELLDLDPENFLPRVLCYCDDVLGYPWGESNGERRAIADFNASRTSRVIDHLPGFRHCVAASEFHSRWVDSMYLAHILDHPRYGDDEGVAIVTRLDLE